MRRRSGAKQVRLSAQGHRCADLGLGGWTSQKRHHRPALCLPRGDRTAALEGDALLLHRASGRKPVEGTQAIKGAEGGLMRLE